jgi:exosortase J
MLGAHDTLLCHTARGEDWLWHGDLRFATAAAATNFSGSLFNNGATQYLEAASVCTGTVCGQTATTGRRIGLVFSRPDPHSLLDGSPSKPIPILLRAETPDAALPLSDARAELTQTLKDFLAGANLAAFTAPYRQQQR